MRLVGPNVSGVFNLHENFVGQFLRLGLIADEPHKEAKQPNLMAADQSAQSELVQLGDAPDQIGVVGRWGHVSLT
jgi:hypothetical protein